MSYRKNLKVRTKNELERDKISARAFSLKCLFQNLTFITSIQEAPQSVQLKNLLRVSSLNRGSSIFFILFFTNSFIGFGQRTIGTLNLFQNIPSYNKQS